MAIEQNLLPFPEHQDRYLTKLLGQELWNLEELSNFCCNSLDEMERYHRDEFEFYTYNSCDLRTGEKRDINEYVKEHKYKNIYFL